MGVDWRDDWLFRIICWLALQGLGLVSLGLLMFGALARAQGIVGGIGPIATRSRSERHSIGAKNAIVPSISPFRQLQKARQ